MKYMRILLAVCVVFYANIGYGYDRSHIDVTLIGTVKYADGLGRLTIGFTDVLHDDLSINHRRLPREDFYDFKDVSSEIKAVFENPDQTPGNVSLLMFPLWWHFFSAADFVPEESTMKIAYSMIESTILPAKWVSILNERFDAVAVPDEFYKSVYSDSGVKIPIFVLPHGIYVEDFLAEPVKKRENQAFTFGLSAGFWARKNQVLLVEAFHRAFGSSPDVELVLHGRDRNKSYMRKVEAKVKELGATNIRLIYDEFSDVDYKAFLKSLDCYALLSRAEGFSVTPREALALGIPCIITNNTAHKTICKSGYVRAVPSEIQQKAEYKNLGLGDCGNDFNCTIEDASAAFKDVYENYEKYKELALRGRQWVKRYLWSNVKESFRNLVKPKKLILGEENIISKDSLTTNSEKLYNKYKYILEEGNSTS